MTDLDEEDPKPKEITEVTNEVAPKKPEALNYAAALKEVKDVADHPVENKSPPIENPTPSSSESHVQEVKEVKQHHYNQKRRSIKTVLNRNKSGANDGKVKILLLYFLLFNPQLNSATHVNSYIIDSNLLKGLGKRCQ